MLLLLSNDIFIIHSTILFGSVIFQTIGTKRRIFGNIFQRYVCQNYQKGKESFQNIIKNLDKLSKNYYILAIVEKKKKVNLTYPFNFCNMSSITFIILQCVMYEVF